MEQTVRQQARARAREARAKVRQDQAQRERRLAKRGELVALALAERDAVTTDCEQRAGRALRSLIEDEGLATQEALAWCGVDTLTAREVYRLIRGVIDEDKDGTGGYKDQGEENRAEDRSGDQPASAGPPESMPG